MSDQPVEYPKVRIRYEGPRGSHSVVGLSTRIKYGRHEHGDVFWVHRDDVEANSEWFVALGDQDGGSIADSLPKTPDAIRLPGSPPPSEPIIPPYDEASQISPANAEERFLAEKLAAQAIEEEDAPDLADRPTNLITLDQVGISERVAGVLAGAGISSVADAVAVIEGGGADSLREIEGIGQGSVKEIVEKLTEAGYLPEAGE